MNDHAHERQIALDSEALRRLIDMARRGCAPYRPHDVVLDGERAERIRAALKRIPELERELADARESIAWRDDWIKSASPQLEHAERVEAAARRIVSRVRVGADLDPLVVDLQAALAPAQAEEMPNTRQADREDRC